MFGKLDKQFSQFIWRSYTKKVGSIYPLFLLEWSGHGALWIVSWSFVWVLLPSTQDERMELVTRFLFGMFTDLLMVAVIKSLVRRPRPVWNSSTEQVSFQKNKT
jgi:hypothetical protein